MKKLWTLIKLIAEVIYVYTEAAISIIFAGSGYLIFCRLKWKWARKVESKLAFWALRCFDRMMVSNANIIRLLMALGIDTCVLDMRLKQKNDKLSDLWKEGSRIFGWEIIRIHGFTTLIK